MQRPYCSLSSFFEIFIFCNVAATIDECINSCPTAFKEIKRPEWKPKDDDSDSDDDPEENNTDENAEGGEKIPQHDDVLGEPVSPIIQAEV